MPMVPSKFRVRAFERGISVGFWFLDANGNTYQPMCAEEAEKACSYPFLWAFLFWLCCEEFFDSVVHIGQPLQDT